MKKRRCSSARPFGYLSLLAPIQYFDYDIFYVFDENGDLAFSYTIGIQYSIGAPECVVFGLSEEVVCDIFDQYYIRIRAGGQFQCRQPYSGFLNDRGVCFEEVDRSHFPECFPVMFEFYKSTPFRVVQAIYPDQCNVWPWDPKADASFVQKQPRLAVPKFQKIGFSS